MSPALEEDVKHPAIFYKLAVSMRGRVNGKPDRLGGFRKPLRSGYFQLDRQDADTLDSQTDSLPESRAAQPGQHATGLPD